MDKEWLSEYINLANKFLPKYSQNYEKLSMENLQYEFENSNEYKSYKDYKNLAVSTKKFMNDYRNFMRDYRFGNVKMTDEYLERYLRYSPKYHFYLVSENDIFRDEGLIMIERLKDLENGIDRSWEGVNPEINFEIYDAKNVPSGVLKLSKRFGGSIEAFDNIAEDWLDKVRTFMKN